MYGVVAPKSLPISAYSLFIARDTISMAFVFTLPPLVTAALHERNLRSHALDLGVQLAAPVTLQLISTPLHLLGLNMYNVASASAAERSLKELQARSHEPPIPDA